VELFLVHDTRQSKVGDQQISIVLWRPEEQVLRLQIAMYDAVVVEIRDGRESGSNEVRSVGFVVIAFSADAVEQLAAERKIGDEVDWCV
jgi:hypothetical protein